MHREWILIRVHVTNEFVSPVSARRLRKARKITGVRRKWILHRDRGALAQNLARFSVACQARVPRPASSASTDDTKLNCCKRSLAMYFVFCKLLFGVRRPTSAQWPNPTRSKTRTNGRVLTDHSRSGVHGYYFGRFCLSVAPCGAGAPLFPLVHLLPHLSPFSLFPFFRWLYLFSSFVHPFPLYQNSPSPFPGRRS